jgi:sulfite exporter TauE/SafE
LQVFFIILKSIGYIKTGGFVKKNMESLDRTLRIIAGVVIVVLGLVYQSWWGLIGLIPLLTAFVGFCPAYAPFRLSTKKQQTPQ